MNDADATPEATPPAATAAPDPGQTDSPAAPAAETPAPQPTDTPAPQPTVIVSVPPGADYSVKLDTLHSDAQVGIALLLVAACLLAVLAAFAIVRSGWGR